MVEMTRDPALGVRTAEGAFTPTPTAKHKLPMFDRTLLLRVGYADKVRLLQIASRPDVALDSIEHLEPYGFTSHPLVGAEAITANPGGNSGRPPAGAAARSSFRIPGIIRSAKYRAIDLGIKRQFRQVGLPENDDSGTPQPCDYRCILLRNILHQWFMTGRRTETGYFNIIFDSYRYPKQFPLSPFLL